MLSAGLAVEPAHRVGHGLGPSLGTGLGAGGLGAALGAGLGPPAHHSMLQAFTGGEFLRPLPPHRPGEPGLGATMLSPPDLRFWLQHHHHHQQQQHLARYAAASQSVSHHRLPASPTPSPQAPPAPPTPAPSPAPVNLTAPHKDDKDRLGGPHAPHAQHATHAQHAPHAQHAGMGYHHHYTHSHYPMAAPMFPPAAYSPYASRLPPPSDAPAAYSPPAGSPAPMPPLGPPPPKPAVTSKTFKVPVPAGPAHGAHSAGKEHGKHRVMTQPKLPTPTVATPLITTTATPHPVPSATVAQIYPQSQASATPAGEAANTKPQFWNGSLIMLESGELKKVQEMKAEDFISSSQINPRLVAGPATVIRITSLQNCRVSVALRLGDSSDEAEVETTSEHPFCVYGTGWASCSPDRSLQLLGLSCRHLQVGDVVVSLSPRPKSQQQPPPASQQQQQRPTQRAQTSAARGGRVTKKQQQQQQQQQLQQQQQQLHQQQQQQQLHQQQQLLQQQHQIASRLPSSTAHPRIPHPHHTNNHPTHSHPHSLTHLPGPASAPNASVPTGVPGGLPAVPGDAAAGSGSKKRRWSAPDQIAAAEEANAANAFPPKLARVPE